MKTYQKLRSSVRPQNIEITSNNVFIASDITPYTETIDNHTLSGFEYKCTEYSKDEYIKYLHNALIDTQLALLEVMEDE